MTGEHGAMANGTNGTRHLVHTHSEHEGGPLLDGEINSSTLNSQHSQANSSSLDTSALHGLHSKDHRNILDVVDKLRLCGLGELLSLPQLVVVGDQSSGKSSVLEAITQVPFPRKENMCTRFATEIVLRRDNVKSISIKINPDDARSSTEKDALKTFKHTIQDFSELPALIDKATTAMGLDNNAVSARGTRAFTRDVLSIEIAGPDRPHLTLVDLPGLIMSPSAEATEEDVKLIHQLVSDYLAEPRTIMLAVVSAKNDYNNQQIIAKCSKVDPEGHRTLGIVTKPDSLEEGSKNEDWWINLVQNKNVHLRLGWHILRNRKENELASSFTQRNETERTFFNSGSYRQLQPDNKGITTLCTRLSKLLYNHLKQELPKLQKEAMTKYTDVCNSLTEMGERRSDLAEQKRFLTNLSAKYQGTLKAALDGHYEGDFFAETDVRGGFEHGNNQRRLRAAVQHLNLQFASQMRQYGHTYRIMATESTVGTNSDDDLPEIELGANYAEVEAQQETKTREEAVEWVQHLLARSRGRELPGSPNPLLISELFWQQSKKWHSLAQEHVEIVSAFCASAVSATLSHVTAFPEVADQLKMRKIDGTITSRLQLAYKELEQLIQDKQRHPIIYDPSYLNNVQAARSKKTMAKIERLLNSGVEGQHGRKSFNLDALRNGLNASLVNPDMDKSAAEDALDSQIAFYKDKIRFFIAAVTEQVIERHLLRGLEDQTFSPIIVAEMGDEEISAIAAESDEATSRRDFLEHHRTILDNARLQFKKTLGAFH